MSYSTYYDVTECDDTLIKCYNTACFSSHYNRLNIVNVLDIYVPIYGTIENNHCKFTLDDVLRYNKLLKDCDLNFTFLDVVTLDGKPNMFFYHYKININENSMLSNKLFINFKK